MRKTGLGLTYPGRPNERVTMRVLAAMSCGVASAGAAARLGDAGHEVTGLHLALDKTPAAMRCGARGCLSLIHI